MSDVGMKGNGNNSEGSGHSHSHDHDHEHGGSQSSHHHTSKTGRKGDPRMHKAVAARIANPKLSLFEALKVGGFDYPTDDDSTCIDAEQISLGQRKNQLSRRVRLARKQHAQLHTSGASVTSNKAQTPAASQIRPESKTAQSLPNSVHRQHAGNKHSLLLDEDNFGEEPAMEEHPERDMRMAKFHPQYQPIIVPVVGSLTQPARHVFRQVDHSASQQQSVPQTSAVLPPSFAMTNTNMNHLLHSGIYHPQQHHQQQQQTQSMLAAAVAKQQQHQQQQHQQALLQVASLTSAHTSPPTASGVALASLQHTAARVGLTLEQLALALQSSSNLAQVLLSNSNGAARKSQEDLALSLYQNECRALYHKVMLLAGYSVEDANEGSTRNLQFALAAWQAEGKRLQDFVLQRASAGDAPMEVRTLNAASLEQQQQQQQQLHQQQQQQAAEQHQQLQQPPQHEHHHNHEHSHGHDHGHDIDQKEHAYHDQSDDASDCCIDGRHVHRLEGKCGHKAILHQPENGNAHIDFVVGDQVECYQGVAPLQRNNSASISVWPSKHKCEESSCPARGGSDDGRDYMNLIDPKILRLEDLDMDGKEWIAEFSNDESVLGLFKLQDPRNARDLNGD